MIGLLWQKTKIKERFNAVHLPQHPFPAIAHGDIALAMIGLLGWGQPDFAAIESLRGDLFFPRHLAVGPDSSEATLRRRGQESLRDEGLPPANQAPRREPVSRRRLRSVMQDLIYMAGQVITHARRVGLAFGKGNPWYRVWRRVYTRFAAAAG